MLSDWETAVCVQQHCVTVLHSALVVSALSRDMSSEQSSASAYMCASASMWFVLHCQADSMTVWCPFLHRVIGNELLTIGAARDLNLKMGQKIPSKIPEAFHRNFSSRILEIFQIHFYPILLHGMHKQSFWDNTNTAELVSNSAWTNLE